MCVLFNEIHVSCVVLVPFIDTSSQVGGVVGGVVGGIVGLAAVLFVVLVVGILIARKKPGDRGWRYHSILPTTTATSASTGIENLVDEGPLLHSEVDLSENDTAKMSTPSTTEKND